VVAPNASPAVAVAPPREARAYDVIVWGATGFTGQLVAAYLARHHGAPGKLSWALGGRNLAKLEEVRRAIAADSPRAAALPLVLGDSRDRASLDAIVRDARVVITTVGPYALHGRSLVAACVDAGTDYVDLAGETPFIRDMIDAHHVRATKSGARIVHACGYDSIPSDLGVLMLQDHARAKHGGRCPEIRFFAGETKGGTSGGTVASLLNVMEEARRNPRVRRVLGDPYALVPDHEGRGPDGRDQLGVRWDDQCERWTGPFVLGAINTRVVRRTNALLGYAYGKDFRYSEATSFGAGAKGFLTASAVSVAVGALMVGVTTKPIRALLERTVLPAPGEGPSKEAREAGYFTSRLYGTVEGRGGRVKLVGTVKGVEDPGYGETAKMLSEAAVSLVDGSAARKEGGVLTPASCMGLPLVDRLRQRGMTFEVTER